MSTHQSGEMQEHTWHHRVWSTTGIVAGTILLLAFFWVASDVILLVFGSILLSLLFRMMADGLARYTPVPERWSLLVALLLLLVALVVGIWSLAPEISRQVQQLAKTIPAAWTQLQGQLSNFPLLRSLMAGTPDALPGLSGSGQTVQRVTGFLSSSLGVLANIFLILVLSLFFASDPKTYKEGLVRLLPISRRPRASEVMSELSKTLRAWMLAQLFAMVVIGVLTGSGLFILGIPLAFALTLLAALFNFIPNIGPLIAGAPAVLLAFTHGYEASLWVVALYFSAQTLEGNFITPMIQQRAVAIPPALTIAAQLVLGVLFGFAGLALATPLAVTAMVLVRMLYIEDVLGDREFGAGKEEQTGSGTTGYRGSPASSVMASPEVERYSKGV
ncbi:MAG: AI-2E family transporter [Bryobacteraceae bacterium]|nr:AI-2E family transporter [Bryobacteraceae bacterium]